MGFSRQKYWSGLPCPPTGDLPGPGIKPMSCLLHWQVGSLQPVPPGNHCLITVSICIKAWIHPWKKIYDKPRHHKKKQRHHFAKKGLYSQSYGFSVVYRCESWS
ncbi:unnamed protein product [Rangifer tarandus platyrhynchus]|uniref:Uncharacterized protein n=1 Tax=Rangifer tarandus platyrhynchus TaxID=3082113 RepID=A0AC59Z0B6_RANTA